MSGRLGIDIGETGTDFLLLDEETGRTHSLKIQAPVDDLAETVGRGVRDLADRAGIAPGQIGTVVSGVGDLPGDGPVGLLVTQGFRHVLHLGRGGGNGSVRLDLTEEIAERVSADGNTLAQLDEAAAARAINRLLQGGARALAVCLINAHANPAHELRLREIAANMAGDVAVVLSHEVAPEAGEYERALATLLTARQRPGLGRRLDAVRSGLKTADISPGLDVAGAGGGRSGAGTAADMPIGTTGASRAGAASAAARIAAAAGFADALVLDLGGGAAHVALVRGGAVRVSNRTATGAGPVPQASLDVRRVGGGSRSMATVPYAGAIHVGGTGDGPTVDDACVVLGRVPSARGTGREAAAEQAMAAFAATTGLDRHRAAEGIVEIFAERLAGALRLAAVGTGEEPSRLALVACGGAGPMHGCLLGALTECGPVIVPRDAASLAALGFATAGRSVQFAQGVGRTLDNLSPDEIADYLGVVRARADAWLAGEGGAGDDKSGDDRSGEIAWRADLRVFRGAFEMSASVDPAALAEPGGLAALADRLAQAHRRRFGLAPTGPAELVALRAIATMDNPPVSPKGARSGGSDPRAALIDQDQVWFDGGFVATSIFDRDRLQAGNRIVGPALVIQPDTTTVIHPGHAGDVDDHLNILIRPGGGQGR